MCIGGGSARTQVQRVDAWQEVVSICHHLSLERELHVDFELILNPGPLQNQITMFMNNVSDPLAA